MTPQWYSSGEAPGVPCIPSVVCSFELHSRMSSAGHACLRCHGVNVHEHKSFPDLRKMLHRPAAMSGRQKSITDPQSNIMTPPLQMPPGQACHRHIAACMAASSLAKVPVRKDCGQVHKCKTHWSLLGQCRKGDYQAITPVKCIDTTILQGCVGSVETSLIECHGIEHITPLACNRQEHVPGAARQQEDTPGGLCLDHEPESAKGYISAVASHNQQPSLLLPHGSINRAALLPEQTQYGKVDALFAELSIYACKNHNVA